VRDWGWGQPPLSFWDSDSDPKTLGHWKAEASEGMREAAGGSGRQRGGAHRPPTTRTPLQGPRVPGRFCARPAGCAQPAKARGRVTRRGRVQTLCARDKPPTINKEAARWALTPSSSHSSLCLPPYLQPPRSSRWTLTAPAHLVRHPDIYSFKHHLEVMEQGP
jgi:hypothetical protein